MKRLNVFSAITTPFFLSALVFVAALYQGCGQGPTEQDQSAEMLAPMSTQLTPTYSSLYANIFSQVCTQCHYPGGSAMLDGVEVDFSSAATGFTTLTGGTVKGIQGGPGCSGIRLVKAGAHTESYAIGLLVESESGRDYNPGPEVCIPPVFHVEGGFLSLEGAQALIQWVNEGAQNN